jgi:uncharacterized repeat protein (TIGR03847 family)
MSELELSPEVFTADYVGEPGKRTFFLQARGESTASFLVEKQQVGLLAERMRDVLLLIDQEDTIKSAMPGRDPGLELAGPVEPEWRVGNMGLAYDESSEQVIVLLEEVRAQEEDETEPDPDAPAVRVMLRRDQARSFILHALAVVGEGRPICQLCGLPMDPAGHQCPASNGHHVQTPEP